MSLLHATLGRPQKALAAMMLFHDRCVDPASVEYIFAVEESDETAPQLIHELALRVLNFQRVHVIEVRGRSSAAAWDAAAKASQGQLLIQAQDAVDPPERWDRILVERIESTLGAAWVMYPACIAVSDGYRKGRLMTTAIITRNRMWQEGCFIPPAYQSVFSDDELSYRLIRDAAAGRCRLIEARDIVFLHRHHYHDPSVPSDATYLHENSDVAYATGAMLFAKRNPEAVRDGIRNWS